ncbi:MAG TPA: hypothetical protein VF546_17405 [Pyrinomonadaceae bacterium]
MWLRAACALLFACAWLCCLGSVRAQTVDVQMRVVSLAPPRVSVEGRRDKATTAWSFRNAYAGLLGLGARVEQFALTDEQGASVAVRRLAPGEYEAARAAVGFRYEVKLDPPAPDADAAHVSWLTPERGILMPGDLLPLPVGGAKIKLALPDGWESLALEAKGADGVYQSAQAETSVLLIGPDWRRQTARAGALSFALVAAGDWAFTDEDAARLVRDVLTEHERATGAVPRADALVVLAPFPRPVPAHVWSAEARGGTVLMLTGRTPAKTAALAQLSLPLTHELFHLWVPNALALAGAYDWFFEGFTLQRSASAGVRTGSLTFQTYLDNLALAYDRTRQAREAAHVSLLDAARRRWSDPAAVVYHKGALAAYLYDLNVRYRTGGQRSLDDVYRALFKQRQANAGRDGSAVVLELLTSVAGDPTLAERYVKSADELDLAAELAPFGLQVATEGARTRVTVAAQLSRQQRDLLRQMGYNATGRAGHQR